MSYFEYTLREPLSIDGDELELPELPLPNKNDKNEGKGNKEYISEILFNYLNS